mgnify:CR=1 FL=1
MKSRRVSSNKYGVIYKLESPLIIILNNTKSIFGIESAGNYGEYVKWNIENIDESIIEFESFLRESHKDLSITSSIIKRDNYPLMIQTKLPNYKNIDIVRSEQGDITTIHNFIKKNNFYNLILEIKGFFVSNKEIKYTIYIKKIELRSNN